MKKYGFTVLFLLIIIADLLALGGEQSQKYRFATKPAITISLMIYTWVKAPKESRIKFGLLLGLMLFLIGNISLMFDGPDEWYFISGIVAFIAGHLIYAYALYRKSYLRHGKLEPSLVGLTLYILMVFYIIGGSLDHLLPYVLIYMMVLMLFVLIAFIRLPFVPSRSGVRVLTGALLFVVSATVLAIDRFAWPQAGAEYIVLASYCLGQFFFITGGVAETDTPVST